MITEYDELSKDELKVFLNNIVNNDFNSIKIVVDDYNYITIVKNDENENYLVELTGDKCVSMSRPEVVMILENHNQNN